MTLQFPRLLGVAVLVVASGCTPEICSGLACFDDAGVGGGGGGGATGGGGGSAVDAGVDAGVQDAGVDAGVDPCESDTCGAHGSCVSGSAVCTCDTGYTGTTCDACAATYISDGNGACVLDPCQATTCGDHGTCASGSASCTCDTGYSGATCSSCAPTFISDGNGACVLDPCQATTCGGHGTCTSGSAACTCDTGYTGATCGACAATYISGGNGTCVLDPCQATTCGGHGTCTSGSAACTCDTGYTGATCGACAATYISGGNGTCVLDPCQATTCSGHGMCSSGSAACICDTGYTGATCSACAANYIQFPSGSGSCIADPCIGNTCSNHGSCSNTTGVAVCTCNAGFAEADCSRCVRYASPTGGTGNAQTWANAGGNLNSVVTAARAAITGSGGAITTCEVWAKSGIYYLYPNRIGLQANVELYGGFTGSETRRAQRDFATNTTVLDPRQSDGGVLITNGIVNGNAQNTVLDGFTLRNGYAYIGGGDDKGGAYSVNAGSHRIANCRFEDNMANGTGGAVHIEAYNSTTSIVIEKCVFLRNHSNSSGGGLSFGMFGGVTASLSDLQFFGNTASSGGGAIWGQTTNVVVNKFENVLLIGNRAASGGAMDLGGTGAVSMSNVTAFGNGATNGIGGLELNQTPTTVTNSIFQGNGTTRSLNSGATVTFSYSDIAQADAGVGVFDADPQFVARPNAYDWAIDGGTAGSFVVSDGSQYSAGQTLELGFDGVARTVTSVAGQVVSFSPSRATGARLTVANWGSGATSVTANYELQSTSMCIDAANGALAPVFDLLGRGRVNQSRVDTGVGVPSYADLGAFERQ